MDKIYILGVWIFVLINNLILGLLQNPNVFRAVDNLRIKASESAMVIRELIRWLARRDVAVIRKMEEIPQLGLMVLMEVVELFPEVINVLISFFKITPYQFM